MAEGLFAGYELIGQLAKGGMGEVYLARRFGGMRFEKLVAVKRILPVHSSSQEYVDLFAAEARLLSRLTHPNIVQVLDCGFAEGHLFLVLEYVHGENLGQLMRCYQASRSGMTAAMVAHVGAVVARALHHAHEAVEIAGRHVGVVHGDVSPSNILVSYDGLVKLIDFGVARAAGNRCDGTVRGNPCYMAPEVLEGAAADRRSDEYALGIVLWEMTAGRCLFSRESLGEVGRALRFGRIPRLRRYAPHVPPALETLVEAMLEWDPARRPATALEIARQLERVGREHPPFDEVSLAEIMQIRFAAERARRDGMLEAACAGTFHDYLDAERSILGRVYEGLKSTLPVNTADLTLPIRRAGK